MKIWAETFLYFLIYFNTFVIAEASKGAHAATDRAEIINVSHEIKFQPKCQRFLRATLGLILGAEKFLNKELIVRKGTPNDQDLQAISVSLTNSKHEVQYFEVIDDNKKSIIRIDPLVGARSFVIPKMNLKRLFEKLWDLKLENRHIWIRDTHTHPPTPIDKSQFSPADIEGMFTLHALLELSGFKHFGIEYSILYRQYLRSSYEKKTIAIAPGQLSFVNGDYSLGRFDVLRKLPAEQQQNLVKEVFAAFDF